MWHGTEIKEILFHDDPCSYKRYLQLTDIYQSLKSKRQSLISDTAITSLSGIFSTKFLKSNFFTISWDAILKTKGCVQNKSAPKLITRLVCAER